MNRDPETIADQQTQQTNAQTQVSWQRPASRGSKTRAPALRAPSSRPPFGGSASAKWASPLLCHLERLIGSCNRPPHMSDRAIIVPQSLLGLLEVASDDFDERIDRDHSIWIEGIQVINCNQASFHVPLMFPHRLVGRLDIRRRNVIGAKHDPIEVRVFIPYGRIGEISESLMVTNRKGNLL